MDSEKGNRVLLGAHCAPPWFLEPKKSLVWIGLSLCSCVAKILAGVAMRHKEEQHRAAAGLLIWSIVAQALLLFAFQSFI